MTWCLTVWVGHMWLVGRGWAYPSPRKRLAADLPLHHDSTLQPSSINSLKRVSGFEAAAVYKFNIRLLL
ncbi:hypothetical protein HBH98_050020 [Parastagonospora nodorum]|nr:hypothetical protein HBI13_037410 [Parastagonospora nodorum]KAH4034385.1 hypothetical protein HBI09_109890 [Parastagonospora nodorum]KAH4076561.1 hypothetical protein HBH50_007340 [Parastagonospora nodorum]KAH4236727.1 hypothetical protein HBI06_052090 [Parastagonospora nodorum]KAH4248660.1 hypothetical protein HBI05_022430 [Parastagonospora nodorum]